MPGPESKEINFVRRKKKRGGKKGYKYIKHFFKQLAYKLQYIQWDEIRKKIEFRKLSRKMFDIITIVKNSPSKLFPSKFQFF